MGSLERTIAVVSVDHDGSTGEFFFDVEWGTLCSDGGFTLTITDCQTAWTAEGWCPNLVQDLNSIFSG